ncbi:MAG: murein biosynthesis integral membrane protein MurJ [Tissierellia bacterium]|nr:murein biosynthesis integral membrane protein MurJ [Tissierellia bacterium]
MGQTAFMLMIMAVLSKIFGFVREMVMGYYYGTGDIVSIYLVANTIPVIAINFIANGIAAGFIPIYNKAKKEKGIEAAEDFTSNLLNITFVFGSIIIAIGMIFAKPLCMILSPDLIDRPELLSMAVVFTRIMMFAVYAYLYSSVFRGYLNLKGSFFVPVSTGIIMNIIIIVFIVLSGIRENAYLLAVGALLGNTLQYIYFPKASKKYGYKYKFKINKNDYYLKQMLKIAIPIILSVAAAELALLVDNAMASSFFGNDKISVLNYSKKLLGIIYGVITVSVTTSIYPTISSLANAGKIDKMKRKINSSLVSMLALVIPAVVGIMVLSKPVISLVYERGAFDNDSVIITSAVMFSYAPYILFTSISDVLDRAFYAVEDSKTPVKIVVIQQIINIILNLILTRIIGLTGIAYATSIACFIGSTLMFISFRKKFGRSNLKRLSISVLKILAISLVMGFTARFLYGHLSQSLSGSIALIITILVAILVYGILILFARIPEVMRAVNKIYHKIKNKKKQK